MVHPYQVGKVFPSYLLFKKVLPAHFPHQPHVLCNVLTNTIRYCGRLGAGDSGSVPPLARGHNSFSLRSLREGAGSETPSGLSGVAQGASYLLSCNPVNCPSFLFCGCCYLCRFRSEGRSLGCCCHSVQAGGATHTFGLCVSGNRPRTAAPFAATTSPLIPQDNLHGPCRKRLVSSWGVWHVVPCLPVSIVAYPIDVVLGSGLFGCVSGVRRKGQP